MKHNPPQSHLLANLGLAALFLGWLVVAWYWAVPSPKDQLFVYEQKSQFQQATQLLERLLGEKRLPKRYYTSLAEYHLALGQAARVEALLNQGFIPESYWPEIAKAYRRSDDQANLLRVLKIIQQSRPEDETLNLEIVNIQRYLKDYEKAIDQMAELVKRNGDNPDLVREYAQLLIEAGRVSEALEHYAELARQQQSPEIWEETAEIALWQGKVTFAESALTRAWELDPSKARTLRLAIFYDNQKQRGKASQTYRTLADQFLRQGLDLLDESERLIALQTFDYLDLRDYVQYLLKRFPIDAVPESQRTMFFYIALKHKATDVLDSLFALLKLNPTPQFYRNQFDFEIYHNHPRKAEQALKQLDLKGQSTEWDWQVLAENYRKQQRFDDVMRLWEKQKLSDQIWLVLSQDYRELKQPRLSVEALRVYALYENSEQTWKDLANLLLSFGWEKEGLEVYFRRLVEPSDQPRRWKEYAELAYWNHHKQEGMRAMEQAVQMNPDPKWQKQLADWFVASGDLARAEASYREMVQAHPSQESKLNLIGFFLETDQLPKAVVEAKKLDATALKPKQKIMLLNVFVWSGNNAKAIELLDHIPLELLPRENTRLYYDLALLSGRLRLAEDLLERLPSSEDETPLWELQVQLALKAGDTDKAEQVIQRQIRFSGPNAALYKGLADIYESDLRQDDTIKAMEQALLFDPEDEELLDGLLQQYEFSQAWSRAEQFLTKLFQRHPNAKVRKRLVRYYIERRQGLPAARLLTEMPPKDWDADFEQYAVDVTDLVDNPQAQFLALYNIYQNRPSHGLYLQLVGITRQLQEPSLQKQYSQMLRQLKQDYHSELAEIEALIANKELEKAKGRLLKLFEQSNDAARRLSLAQSAQAAPLVPTAEKLYRQLLRLHPEFAEAKREFGLFLAAQNRLQEAIDPLEIWQSEHPEDQIVWQTRLSIYINQLNHPNAREFFREAIEKFKKKPRLTLAEKQLQAYVHYYGESQAKGLERQQQLVQEYPDSQSTFINYLDLLIQSGRYREVLQVLEKPHPLEKQSGAYLSRKADAQLNLGQYEQAIDTLQAYVVVAPDNPTPWINLGYALAAIGDQDRSFKAFQTAKKLSNANSIE